MANTALTLTLEWLLNADHIPFIAGIYTGTYDITALNNAHYTNLWR